MSDGKNLTTEESRRQQMTEEEREREKKKALLYFTAAYCDAVERKKEEEFLESLAQPLDVFNHKFKQDVMKEYAEVLAIRQLIADAVVRKKECFTSDNKKENEELTAKAQNMGVEERYYSTLALCAAVRHFEGFIDYINNGTKVPDLDKKKEESLADLNNALDFYGKGVSVYLAYMLGYGLQKCVKGFKAAKDKKTAVLWSDHIESILEIYDQKKDLLEGGGLEEKTMKEAREAVQFGSKIKKGAAAVERLAASEFGEAALSAADKKKLINDVVGMNLAFYNKDVPVGKKLNLAPEPVVRGGYR